MKFRTAVVRARSSELVLPAQLLSSRRCRCLFVVHALRSKQEPQRQSRSRLRNPIERHGANRRARLGRRSCRLPQPTVLGGADSATGASGNRVATKLPDTRPVTPAGPAGQKVAPLIHWYPPGGKLLRLTSTRLRSPLR